MMADFTRLCEYPWVCMDAYVSHNAKVESDMTVKPYESEADREARRKAEEEKRTREEEAKGSNDKFRALDVSREPGYGGVD